MMNEQFAFDKAEKYMEDAGLLMLSDWKPTEEDLKDTASLLKAVLLKSQDKSSLLSSDGSLFCKHYSCRTVTDLYRLCKHYRQEISLEEVYSSLIDLLSKEEIVSWICREIKKRTYWCPDLSTYGKGCYTGSFNSDATDEYGYNFPESLLEEHKYSGYGDESNISHLKLELYE